MYSKNCESKGKIRNPGNYEIKLTKKQSPKIFVAFLKFIWLQPLSKQKIYRTKVTQIYLEIYYPLQFQTTSKVLNKFAKLIQNFYKLL